MNQQLVQLLSMFNQEQINIVPFQGSWTAAQVIKHLNLSDTIMLQFLHGSVKTTERQPDQNVQEMENIFLDFTIKINSPESDIPENVTYDKEQLVSVFVSTRTRISESFKTLDLSETCSALDFPGYGNLTRLELSWLIVYHTQRHIHQLENLLEKM